MLSEKRGQWIKPHPSIRRVRLLSLVVGALFVAGPARAELSAEKLAKLAQNFYGGSSPAVTMNWMANAGQQLVAPVVVVPVIVAPVVVAPVCTQAVDIYGQIYTRCWSSA